MDIGYWGMHQCKATLHDCEDLSVQQGLEATPSRDFFRCHLHHECIRVLSLSMGEVLSNLLFFVHILSVCVGRCVLRIPCKHAGKHLNKKND